MFGILIVTYALAMLYIVGIARLLFVSAALYDYTSLQLQGMWRLGVGGILLFGFSAAIAESTIPRFESFIFPLLGFCIGPLLTLCFCLSLFAESKALLFLPDRMRRIGFTFLVGVGLIWSPVAIPKGIHVSCDTLHQWQVAILIQGLRHYHRDRAHYPDPWIAFMPYYVEQPVGVFCFGGEHNRYRLEMCEDSATLLLQGTHPTVQNVYRVESGVWSIRSASEKACD